MKVDLFIQVLSGVILELITDILHISFSKCITNLNHMNTSSKVKKKSTTHLFRAAVTEPFTFDLTENSRNMQQQHTQH